MPEGPEIRLSTEFLSENLVGNRIEAGVRHTEGRYRASEPHGWKELTKGYWNIEEIGCKGKLVYWKLKSLMFHHLNQNYIRYILNTYGMSGQWIIVEGGRQDNKATHPCISLCTCHRQGGVPEERTWAYFNDIRHFGTIKVVTPEEFEKKLKSLGPDIFKCTPEEFCKRFKKRPNKTLAEAMMNQRVVSGIGNYIKAESLYRARLSPHTLVKDMTDAQLEKLYQAVQEVIEMAHQEGGATIQSFKNPDGSEGYAAKNFQVYKKKKDPHGNDVISEETKDKRTTWWVPILQK